MKNRIRIVLSLAAALAVSVTTALTAQADSLNLKQDMSVTVGFQDGDTKDTYDNAKKSTTETLVYDLYKIANVTNTGGFSFEVVDTYKDSLGSKITTAAKLEKEENETTGWDDVAQTALQTIIGDAGAKVNAPDSAAYTGVSLDVEQSVDKGLYLLVVRNSANNKTIVKSVAQASSNTEEAATTRLETYTMIGNYAFSFQPQIICVPTTDEDTDGQKKSTGTWNYNQTIYLKPTVQPATGSIKINKTLTGYYVGAENATFIFQVDTYYPTDTELYSSETYAITFTAAGDQTIQVDGIPIGAKVEVSEVYTGVNYQLKTSNNTTITLTGNETTAPTAAFVNECKGRAGGGGVTNHFTYGTSDGTQVGTTGWYWKQTADGNISTSNGLAQSIVSQLADSVSDDNQGSDTGDNDTGNDESD